MNTKSIHTIEEMIKDLARSEFGTLEGVDIVWSRDPENGRINYFFSRR